MHTYKATIVFRYIAWFLLRFLMFREISVYMFTFLLAHLLCTRSNALFVLCVFILGEIEA